MIDKENLKQAIENWHSSDLNPLRAAGHTKRCHIKQTIGQQTVAEHSFHVCMLCWKLCDREPSANLLKAALFHDLAETVTGDVPAPVKWNNAAIRDGLAQMEDIFNKIHHLEVNLTPQEELVLKWADCLELMWYCVDQIRLGNQNMHDVYGRVNQFLITAAPVKNGLNEFSKVRSAYAIARNG